MTEAEWLAGNDSAPMMEFLIQGSLISERKARLFVCAAVRRWEKGADPDTLRQVAELERLEGQEQDYTHIHKLLLGSAIRWANHWAHREEGRSDKAILLREIVGNPFRKAWDCWCDPDVGIFHCEWCDELKRILVWNESTVPRLARRIYGQGLWEDTAAWNILADALEEAGCDHADLLDHLRGPGPHARGCHVVDLILGKEPR